MAAQQRSRLQRRRCLGQPCTGVKRGMLVELRTQCTCGVVTKDIGTSDHSQPSPICPSLVPTWSKVLLVAI